MTQTEYHQPVLLNEAVDGLITDPNGIYIDATLGGGGHSRKILSRLDKNGLLIGIDQDDEALGHSRRVLDSDGRMQLIKGNFGFIDVLTPKHTRGKVCGILLDLGISSHQIDQPQRGFSFRADGPLDMRMGSLTGLTASEILNTYAINELAHTMRLYGEEKFSGPIARSVCAHRPLETTADLVKAIDTVTPEHARTKTYARIFQAIRIEVNQELEMLRQVLQRGTSLLAEKGRMVVISYHSLEDRLVKNWFRAGNFEGKVKKDFYGNDIKPLNTLYSGAIKPTPDEIQENPRARSARLRIAEKLAEN